MSKLLDIDVNRQLLEILAQFDLKLEQVDDYYFVDGMFPGVVAQAFLMEDFGESVVVQLDITMLFPDNHFVESFVSQDLTVEEALANTFQQFEVNILHAYIVAFWEQGKKVENGVGTDIWEINGHKWQAVVSNFGYRGSEEFETIIGDVDALYDMIVSNIKALPLDENIYAFRTVFTNTTQGEKIPEAYMNNQPFEALEKQLTTLDWKTSKSYYSVRNLVLLMKLKDEVEA